MLIEWTELITRRKEGIEGRKVRRGKYVVRVAGSDQIFVSKDL